MSKDDRHIIERTSRMTLFNLLARAFNYPDGDLIDNLHRGDFTTTLRNALDHLDIKASLAGVIAAIEDGHAGPDKAKDVLLLELEKDYTHMFFSSKPRLVYLFESVYNEGRLLQDSTFQIARLYFDAGLKLVDDFKLPPDHIAVEFEFMAYLYFNEAEAIKKGHRQNEDYARALQKEVMEKHLGAFGGTFAEKVAAHAGTIFYQSMARIAIPLLSDF